MSNEEQLKARLAALEREVEQIKRQLGIISSGSNWVDEVSGSMAEIPGFEEFVRYGREFRQSVTTPDDFEA